MLWHNNRRATPPESKSGPPLRGRSQKTAELRCLLARSPATRLRCTPRQRLSENDHGAQMRSNKGLTDLRGQIGLVNVITEARNLRFEPHLHLTRCAVALLCDDEF